MPGHHRCLQVRGSEALDSPAEAAQANASPLDNLCGVEPPPPGTAWESDNLQTEACALKTLDSMADLKLNISL